MAPLDQRDRDLLEGYKASLSPPEDVVQSNWEAIADLVEREPSPRSGARSVWLGVAVGVALVLGSWLGFRASERLRDDDAYRVQSLDHAEAPPGAAAPAIAPAGDASPRQASAGAVPEPVQAEPAIQAEPATQAEPPMPDEPMPETPTRASVGSASEVTTGKPRGKHAAPTKRGALASSPSIVEGSTDLHAELELLGRARGALAAEDFTRVLALVQRHDREFPHGTMREEIALLRVGALCQVGPKERWASARSSFDREFPGSPLSAHLREDCFP